MPPRFVALNELRVVEHQDERTRLGHRRRDAGEHAFAERRVAQLQQIQELRIDAEHPVKRDRQVAQQQKGVVVVAVEP